MQIKGSVKVYECSDGGTGDPRNVFWQVFIDAQPVTTKNPYLAETAALALRLDRPVEVTFDEKDGNTLSQVKILPSG